MKHYLNRKKPFFSFIVVAVVFLFLCLTFAVGLERPIRLSLQDTDIPCEWSGVKRIVAVGDLHGAYEHFVTILIGTKLVDKEELNWIGGKTHLVQIGDVLDRGDKARDIFDLAIKLEKQADEAGGKVHMLIGNHEEMNLANTAFDREGYITPGQFESFLPESYKMKQVTKFQRRSRSKSPDSNGNFSKEWQEIIDKTIGITRSAPRMNYYKNLNELYGDWILGHNVIIKINDIVFVHAGISEPLSQRWTLKEINDTYRLELDDVRRAFLRNQMPKIPEFKQQFFNKPNGPLWDRILAGEETKEYAETVDRILINLQDTNHIVIAHTPQLRVGEEEMKKLGGKVWTIDTGIADYYRIIGGHVSALIIEDGQFSVWFPDSEQKKNE